MTLISRFLPICLLALWTGCGKQPEATPAAAQPAPTGTAAATDVSAPAAGTDSTSESNDAARMAALLGELTQVVRKYSVEKRQVPKDFAELVANGYLARVPEAPAGKTFVIGKDLQVQLK